MVAAGGEMRQPRMQSEAVAGPEGAAPAPLRTAQDLIRTARPQQWLKNLLLYAGFIFSARTAWSWREPDIWGPLLLASTVGFVLFSVAASGGYFVNDALDADRDRAHPRKRFRPVAAGRIPLRVAVATGVLLLGVAAAAALVMDTSFGLLLVAYVVMINAYSLVLKHVVIVDVIVIATGFALRAMAGAAIIDVPISPWLYVCTTLGALFIAVMKRRSEALLMEGEAGEHRGVLQDYTPHVLNQMAAVSMSAAIVAYTLYATTAANLPENNSMLVTLPFVLYGMFRFQLISEWSPDRQADELLLRDVPLMACVLLFGFTALAVLVVDVA